jgi:hypothetical protein
MALYQRGRTWYADFYVQGKRVQESTGTANRREAEKFYALRLAEIERGEYSKPVNITISEFGQQYFDFAKANKRSWLRDEQIMKHLGAFFGNMLLKDVGPLPIERYKLERMQVVAPATVNREIALLKHLFNVAEAWGMHRGRNPVKRVKFLSENNLQFRSLTEEEEIRLAAMLLALPAGPCDIRDPYRNAARRHSQVAMGGGRYRAGRHHVPRAKNTAHPGAAAEQSSGNRRARVARYTQVRVCLLQSRDRRSVQESMARSQQGMPHGGTQGRDVAHLPPHVCFATHARRSGPGDSEGTAGTCEHNNDDALRAYQS